jgi:hypothetical protein
VRARFLRAASVPREYRVEVCEHERMRGGCVDVRLQYLRVLMALLPGEHVRALDLLCSFMHDVARHVAMTKMTSSNLAVVREREREGEG